jgi:alkanesulfonate monooxygenase SsuD/methylene tetrahydromethanopterin reductase-like flavin-dependent oxidoreductase (luciferase family)
MIPFSVLDLSPIVQGGDAAQSFRNTLDLAQHAERWGYQRYWLAEHHGMPGIASAATSVLIAHVAGGTSRIRVGAGGIMLPNHSPLVIAEQFGTLESLFPGRIDLGLGRAPGSDQVTARALRRNLGSDADEFPQDVVELMDYFSPNSKNRARPRAECADLDFGLQPVWGPTGGSTWLALRLCIALCTPANDAGHCAIPGELQAFGPSCQTVCHAGLQRVCRRQRRRSSLSRHVHAAGVCQPAKLDSVLACSAIGTPGKVRDGVKAFIERTGADELMITSAMYDHAQRKRSYEIASGVFSD